MQTFFHIKNFQFLIPIIAITFQYYYNRVLQHDLKIDLGSIRV